MLLKRARNFVQNVLSGIGTDDDPGSSFEISDTPERFTQKEVISAYTLSGQIQRAIDLVPTMATRYIYKNDDGEQIAIASNIEAKLNDLKIRTLFLQASISARLFRESYIMLITNSDNWDKPIADGEEILELLPLESDQLSFSLIAGVREYRLQTINKVLNQGKIVNTSQVIHSSRILMFAGKYLPERIRAYYNGYHGSEIGGILTSYGQYRHSLNVSLSLLSRMQTFVMKVAGFQDYVISENSKGLGDRLSMLKRFIGSIGGFILDADAEEIDWLQMKLDGVPEIIKTHAEQYTAETELTHAELWNEGSHDTTSDFEEVSLNKRCEVFLSMYWQENFNNIYKKIAGTLDTPRLGMNNTTTTGTENQSSSTDIQTEDTNISQNIA